MIFIRPITTINTHQIKNQVGFLFVFCFQHQDMKKELQKNAFPFLHPKVYALFGQAQPPLNLD